MDIFKHNDFRSVLVEKIDENGNVRGYRSRLSEAAGFQRSFLSHVINGSSLLTPDHAVGLSLFWEFSETESEYFCHLVNLSRSQSQKTKHFFNAKLERLRKEQNDISKRLDLRDENSFQELSSYYSSWYYSAIHIATSLASLNSAKQISEKLRLDINLVNQALSDLESMGLVFKSESGWHIGKNHIHLPKGNRWTNVNHSNWRQKAIMHIQESGECGLHYSVIYALSKKDFSRIQTLILNLIQDSKKIVDPSEEEELACFTCDFFPI